MYIVGSLLFMLIMFFVAVFAFGVPILIGVLVYRDANKRVDCSPWLWALVAALVPSFIGVVIYLIIRRDYPLKAEGYRPNTYGAENQYQQYSYQPEPDSDDSAEAQYNSAYSQPMPERKGMPTWGKALLIIGGVVAVILFIAMIVGVINLFTGYAGYFNNDFGYHYNF